MRVGEEQPEDAELEPILHLLSQRAAFDFSGYKHASLRRRIVKRMEEVSAADFAEYRRMLESEPNEIAALTSAILIKVTSFFRNAAAWSFVASDVIPGLCAQRKPGEMIRVWSAGVATGQEACTLAMLFAEAMGIDDCAARVRIYGTDVDVDALHAARLAMYTSRDVQSAPPHLRRKYFVRRGDYYCLRGEFRRMIILGRHDLVRDAPPIDRLDLLACRNIMMYYDAPTQAKIFSRLSGSLREGGYLLLGKAEMLLGREPSLRPINTQCRVYLKSGKEAATLDGTANRVQTADARGAEIQAARMRCPPHCEQAETVRK